MTSESFEEPVPGKRGARMDERASREQEPYLSGEQFRLYRTSRGLTQKEVGEWLGITDAAVLKYEKRGCSRIVALALSALERGLKPWTPTEEDHAAVNGKEANGANDDEGSS